MPFRQRLRSVFVSSEKTAHEELKETVAHFKQYFPDGGPAVAAVLEQDPNEYTERFARLVCDALGRMVKKEASDVPAILVSCAT